MNMRVNLQCQEMKQYKKYHRLQMFPITSILMWFHIKYDNAVLMLRTLAHQ